MNVSAILRMASLLAALHCRPAAGWEPSVFEFYCGSPANSDLTLFEAAQSALNSESAKKIEKSSYEFYREHLGEEVDFPADIECFSLERKTMLEGFAANALTFYRNTGDAQGLEFTSPAPNRLGPVVLDEEGKRVVRLFADPDYTKIGQTLAYPCKGGGICEWSTSIVRFGVQMIANRPPPVAYWLVAHELFHVVQNAQPINSEGSGVTFPGPYWVGEGTADAISHHQVRQRYGKSKLPLSVHGSRSFYGLRPYDRGLTWESGAEKGPWGHALVTDYRASSFWTHIADRYFEGDYYYLIDWFAVPPVNNDWLKWADDLMRYPGGEITHPFYLVFPDFIANYAAWGEKKFDHIGEDTWLQESFDGCELVTLSPGAQIHDLNFELEPISARCFKVRVEGLEPGMAASVIWVAYDSSEQDIDEVHLAASRLGGEIVDSGAGFDCFDATRRGGKADLCLDKPFTGQRGEVKETGEGDWVKTWQGHLQQSQAGSFENLMFVVNTPVYPTDSKHDVNKSEEKQEVRLQIGLEVVEMYSSTHGNTKVASAGANGIATSGQVPMRSGEGTPESQLSNMMSALSGDPEAMSQLTFQQNSPVGTTLNVSGSLEGIEAIFINHDEIRSGMMGSRDLETELALSLLPDEPIRFGSTGTYEAMVTGATGDGSGSELIVGARSGSTAEVDVVQFNQDLLHLKVKGEYCYHSQYDYLKQKCRKIENFQGEIIKPFGWAYDSSQIFSSLDTPGMKEYREWQKQAFSEMFPEQMEPIGAGNPAAPGGPPATGSQSFGKSSKECDCSCTELERIERLGDEWQIEAEAREEAGEFAGFPPPEMMTMLSCMGTCGQQWDACDGD